MNGPVGSGGIYGSKKPCGWGGLRGLWGSGSLECEATGCLPLAFRGCGSGSVFTTLMLLRDLGQG